MHRSGVQNFAWVGCASKIVLRQCRILRLLPVSATQQTVQRANVLKMRVRQKYYQYTPHHRNVLDSPRLCSPSYQLRSQNWRIQFEVLTKFCLTTFFPLFVLGFALSQIPFFAQFHQVKLETCLSMFWIASRIHYLLMSISNIIFLIVSQRSGALRISRKGLAGQKLRYSRRCWHSKGQFPRNKRRMPFGDGRKETALLLTIWLCLRCRRSRSISQKQIVHIPVFFCLGSPISIDDASLYRRRFQNYTTHLKTLTETYFRIWNEFQPNIANGHRVI